MKFCCSDVTMPGLVCKSPQLPRETPGSIADCCQQGGIIACLHKDDVDSRQLSRYWSELSSAARRKLLRIDKQSLFEKVRKNFYCSRCNGLLLEAFSQLATYSKSHQGGSLSCEKHVCGYNECNGRGCIPSFPSEDDIRDPTVHPWGGLIATREGMLTLLDSFWDGQSLDMIKNVCDCARARDRERELLYPDACGGGGRGWITQGSFASNRGHSLKETCALHTARLSCDALVDFWCALGDETRRSLLRMKEEDFIARLMCRFESKRFCRDCRRNVLKELKELKELKRTRKEPKCTRWFCNADTAFQYEVSSTSVNVNWKECFGGDFGSTYQYFEWALGSAEGNADIFDFENVGLSEGAGVDGLNLSQVSLFYITLRAWKHDGRCTEVSVKAHGLKGKQCVHRRLLVGDGHVTITKGDSIKRFFEHAEEAEEDEDDDGMDKSGSEPENEGYRAQKHAKSPELAREFLLDAATIIFKEQVEKAFREGTARQNAHTIFVCLALNLLEERIHVAYKEISTLEKQKQLLEEEEHEKREEQRRRERKRLKEKEKKSRRKGKQKGGVSDKETCKCVLQPVCNTTIDCDSGVAGLVDENGGAHTDDETKDSGSSILDDGISNYIPDIMQASNLESMQTPDCSTFRSEALDHYDLSMPMDNVEELSTVDGNSSLPLERSKRHRRRSRPHRGPFMEVISRRFIRRSSITSFDAMDGLQSHMNVSCTSVRETSEVVTEQVFLSTQKFRRGFIRSERNMKSNSVEGWNNRCLHQRQNGLVLHGTSKRSFYFKSKQNDGTGWVGKQCLSLKGSQRKNSVVVGNQKITRMGSFVSGSSQCSWQIIKGIPTGRAEGELLGHDALVDSEVVSSNSSSESEKMNEPECKEGISAGADALVNTGRHAACDIVSLGCSTDCFVGEQQHNLKVISTDRCQPELVFPTLDSTALVQGLKPTDRAVSLSTGEDLNDNGSPSSAMSCVSDSSDGVASCGMRTECSNFGASCSSIVAPSTELLISIPAEHQIHTREPIQQGVDPGYLRKSCDFAHKHDNHQAVSAVVGRRTDTEYFPYSTAGNIPAYFYDHDRVQEHMRISMNSEVSLLDSIPHMCNTDSTMPLSILPVPLMPLHMSQPFGFPWVPSQCMAEPVMNAGLLPLPYYPGNLYVDGFGPSTAGMQASFLPLQPPVQPLPHFMGISCIAMPSMHQIFTQWSEQQPIYDDRKRVEPLPIRNALEENGPCIDLVIEEQSSRFSNSPSAAQATNMPSNDPLGFSLFHFGSLPTDEQELMLLSQAEGGIKEAFKPLDVSCGRAVQAEGGIKEAFKPLDVSCGRAVQQEAAAVRRSSLPAQEYSLFAATPSSRFGFF